MTRSNIALHLYKQEATPESGLYTLGLETEERLNSHSERVVIPYANSPLTPQKYTFFANLQNLIQISVVAKFAITDSMTIHTLLTFSGF